jgi:hypothetical protein
MGTRSWRLTGIVVAGILEAFRFHPSILLHDVGKKTTQLQGDSASALLVDASFVSGCGVTEDVIAKFFAVGEHHAGGQEFRARSVPVLLSLRISLAIRSSPPGLSG